MKHHYDTERFTYDCPPTLCICTLLGAIVGHDTYFPTRRGKGYVPRLRRSMRFWAMSPRLVWDAFSAEGRSC